MPFIFVLSFFLDGDCHATQLKSFVFPSLWHKQEYKGADWKPIEDGTYTDNNNWIAELYKEFNKALTFSGDKHRYFNFLVWKINLKIIIK